MSRHTVFALVAIFVGASLLGAGLGLEALGTDRVCDPDFWGGSSGRKRCVRYFFPTAAAAGVQLGGAVIAVGLLLPLFSRLELERRKWIGEKLRGAALGVGTLLLISLVSGEVALRVYFWDGMSFGGHGGPLVRRFEQDFVFNRYDGPSRGPQVEGPKPAGAVRVMVQGDSITWGQGVKPERELYTAKLLEGLRRDAPTLELAALATGGREINGHVTQLQRWGSEIDPDVIVYQWFVNDIEIDKSGRPETRLPWHSFFAHPILVSASAFWFFVDHSLQQLWPRERTYADYIESDYAPGSVGWAEFERVFGEWAAEARALTPRVLVVLYPRVNPPDQVLFGNVHRHVRELAEREGFEVLDLIDSFETARGSYEELWASPYDAHPSGFAHTLMAEAIEARLRARWPELLR